MNKSRNNPKPDSNEPKRTITNFVRKTVKLDTPKKTPIFESNLEKTNVWLKRQNDSWEY